jgi:flagellar biosynthesis/type III secretory pathway protein FliH
VSEEEEIPTAARKAGSNIEENPHLDERLRNGDELVRRQDAYDYVEERENKAHKAGYEKGKGIGRHEGREEERQRITELIENKLYGLMGDKFTKEAVDDMLEELLDEVEQE